MTGLLPDCLMLCVSARSGVDRTTQEHLAAALALDVPVFAVIAQADTVTPDALAATVLATRTLLATAGDTAILARSSLVGHSTDDASASDAELTPAAGAAQPHADEMFAIDDDQVRHRHHRSHGARGRAGGVPVERVSGLSACMRCRRRSGGWRNGCRWSQPRPRRRRLRS